MVNNCVVVDTYKNNVGKKPNLSYPSAMHTGNGGKASKLDPHVTRSELLLLACCPTSMLCMRWIEPSAI